MEMVLIMIGSVLIASVFIYIIYEKFFSAKTRRQRSLVSFENTCVGEIVATNLNLKCDYYTEDDPEMDELTNWWVNVSFDKCMANIARKEYHDDESSQVKMYQRRASIISKYFTTQDDYSYFSTDLISFIMTGKHDSKSVKDLPSIFSAYYDYMLKNKIIKNVLVENLKMKESVKSTSLSYNIAKREESRTGLQPVDKNVLSDKFEEIFKSEIIFHDEFKKYYDANKMNDDVNIVGCYILYDTHNKKYYIGHSTKVLSEVNTVLYAPESGSVLQYDVQKGHKFLLRLIPFYLTGYKSIHRLEKDLMAAYKTDNTVAKAKALNDPLPLYSYEDAII